MGAAAGVGTVAAIGSLGLKAWGDVTAGKAKQQEYQFQAGGFEMQSERAQRAADFGRLQAEQTDVTMREQLNTVLGNIDVIRAAAHVDPTSPTTAAVKDFETMKSDRQRTAALVTIRSQVAEDEASAAYLKQAQQFALTAGDTAYKMGWINAGADILGGIVKGANNMGLGSSINSPSVGDPTRLNSLV